MANLNKVVLIGNLIKQQEMKYSPDGTAVTKFTIAVNGFKKDDADFVNIVCFKKIAEVAGEYLDKGKKVCIVGRLSIKNYEKDGQKKQWVEVVANELELLTPKG